jgi:peptidoglycan hydrolase-like protein with peptidoglycan-binding domain
MRIKIAILILIVSVAAIRADQSIESVQQALKEQGFYYGEITGEKNADTTAAIRRFQIRHGLQITGELNEETLRLLGSAAPSASPQPAATRAPPANAGTPEARDESSPQTPPLNPATVAPPADGLFAGTPYENASPDVQRNVVVSAQIALARHDLYHGEIDGIYGPAMEFSLRAYQARIGLPITGRFNLETLAALKLLPGAHTPVFTPRRPVVRPHPEWGPPVRGEWIRP